VTQKMLSEKHICLQMKKYWRTAELGRGGSTAVTAILIDSEMSVKVVVANVGDSRAVISRNGVAKQLSVDHEPNMEQPSIEKKGWLCIEPTR
jgi:protein phosphatase 1L